MLWWWVVGPWHFHVFSLASSRRACTLYFLWGTFYSSEIRMWRQLSSPREPERIEFPSRPALLLICISVLMVFSCKEEGLKGVFNTWDELKPRYQWVWGPTILVLSEGATTLTHITSWARTKAVTEATVLVSAHMGYPCGSAVCPGMHLESHVCWPMSREISCCRLCKCVVFLGYSHLLAYT